MNDKNYTSPAIILVNPQMGENIGAAARAMLNCGLNDLRIVNPRDGWPNPAAYANSSGAMDIMPEVRVYDSTRDALADCNYALATTARPRDMVKDVYTCKSAAKEIVKRKNSNEQTAILFGAERTGLENEDVSLCHGIITIPLNPEFCSLNLGQAVLLAAYELFQLQDNTDEHIVSGDNQPASMKEQISLYDRLEDELSNHGFFRAEGIQPLVMKNLRNFFGRANPTEQEVRTFHGIISALIGHKIKGE